MLQGIAELPHGTSFLILQFSGANSNARWFACLGHTVPIPYLRALSF